MAEIIKDQTGAQKIISEMYKVLFFLNAASLTLSGKSLSIINRVTIIKSSQHFTHPVTGNISTPAMAARHTVTSLSQMILPDSSHSLLQTGLLCAHL